MTFLESHKRIVLYLFLQAPELLEAVMLLKTPTTMTMTRVEFPVEPLLVSSLE